VSVNGPSEGHQWPIGGTCLRTTGQQSKCDYAQTTAIIESRHMRLSAILTKKAAHSIRSGTRTCFTTPRFGLMREAWRQDAEPIL
jgi:hypothetical protein